MNYYDINTTSDLQLKHRGKEWLMAPNSNKNLVLLVTQMYNWLHMTCFRINVHNTVLLQWSNFFHHKNENWWTTIIWLSGTQPIFLYYCKSATEIMCWCFKWPRSVFNVFLLQFFSFLIFHLLICQIGFVHVSF